MRASSFSRAREDGVRLECCRRTAASFAASSTTRRFRNLEPGGLGLHCVVNISSAASIREALQLSGDVVRKSRLPHFQLREAAAAPGTGGEVELQRAAHLLRHVVDERVEHFGLVVAGQAAFLLGAPGLFHATGRTCASLPRWLAGHRTRSRTCRRTLRSRSTEKVVLLAPKSITAMVRSMPPSGIWCIMSRRAFWSANARRRRSRGKASGFHGSLALLDVLGARGTSSTSIRVRIFFRGTEHFEVVADFVHREGDVLVGLHLDLGLELAVAQVARHLDDLGDSGIAAHRDAHLLRSAPARLTARRTASPTACASTIAFSLIAFGGEGSAAYNSTR